MVHRPEVRRLMAVQVADLRLVEVLDALGHSVVLAANREDLPILYVNAAFEALTGWRADDVLGGNCRLLQGTAPAAPARAAFRRAFSTGEPAVVLVANERPDGRRYWNEVALSPIWTEGTLSHYVGVQQDVTDRVEAQERLEALVDRDDLTGVSNRRQLGRWLERFTRDPAAPAAVLFLDVDGFKAINDSIGHRAGDELLRQLVDRLGVVVRPTDVLARLGGDEFVIGLSAPIDVRGAHLAAARVTAAARIPFHLEGHVRRATVSVGVACWPPDGPDPLGAADAAMYRAKRAGGDGWAPAPTPLQEPDR